MSDTAGSIDGLIAWLDATEAHHDTANWHLPLPEGSAALVRRLRDGITSEAASLRDAANETNWFASSILHGAADRLISLLSEQVAP